jgi:hypothetical protein
MGYPCLEAAAIASQLPHSGQIGRSAILLPYLWREARLATLSTMTVAMKGFVQWYKSPTVGCEVAVDSLNPYEDAEWRMQAVAELRSYIEDSPDAEGLQILANYLLGSDRSKLQLALMTEQDPGVLLAWVAVADTVGLKGVIEQILIIGEKAAKLVKSGWKIGSDYLLASSCIALRDGYTRLTSPDQNRAKAIATVANGSADPTVHVAGKGLLDLALFIEGEKVSQDSHPATIPPTSIVPTVELAWYERSEVPLIAGGVSGILLLLLAWLHKRRIVGAR